MGDEGCKALCEALKTNRAVTSIGLGSMPVHDARACAGAGYEWRARG